MNDFPKWKQEVDSLPSPCPENMVTELAGRMRDALLAPGRAAIAAYPHPERSELGRDLIMALDAGGIEAILDAPEPDNPNQRAWLLKQLVQAELDLRARVRARVQSLLDDKALLDDPAAGIPMEVRAPRRRVCDEAYVTMRQLVHPEEDQVGYQVESNAFLNMPEEAKDQTIDRARSAHVWNLKPPSVEELGY